MLVSRGEAVVAHRHRSYKRRSTSYILDRARGAIKRQTSPSGRTSAFYISYELMMVRREVRTQRARIRQTGISNDVDVFAHSQCVCALRAADDERMRTVAF